VHLATRAQLIEKDWVAGFLLRNQLVAKNPDLDFQDRLFQPLAHPSAGVSSIAYQLRQHRQTDGLVGRPLYRMARIKNQLLRGIL
jgi:hypothetical protein